MHAASGFEQAVRPEWMQECHESTPGRLRRPEEEETILVRGFRKEVALELDLERRMAFCMVRMGVRAWGTWDNVSDRSGRGAELWTGNESVQVAEEQAVSGEAVKMGLERKARPGSEDRHSKYE